MEVYRGALELLDYVFFATTERGKVYETGAFIHNYALAYAFRLASAPYSSVIQEPHYEDELRPANERGVYLTPIRSPRATDSLGRSVLSATPTGASSGRFDRGAALSFMSS
jgi:hypothetical protein